jgi:monothiol glutaredoxin
MDNALRQRIEATISEHPVVLFMKGNKLFPQCGFSAKVVEILTRAGAAFHTVNILADQELRQGLKDFSSWPTFPQLYVHGKLVGGSDIVSELEARGELPAILSGESG